MSETRMVAIDPATRVTGCALFVNGELSDYGKIDLSNSKLTTEDRILAMGSKILQTLNVWQPSIVYIEQPQGHGKNLSVNGMIHELIGFASAWCVQHDATIEIVPPSVWRSLLEFKQGGKVKREELKKQSMDAVLDIYGINVIDDIADAIAIGTAMLQKYTGDKE